MDKTALIKYLEKSIDMIDMYITSTSRGVRLYMRDNTDINQNHMQWLLAHLDSNYVSCVHDLERIIKELKGEPFAGKKI